jgi:hypothetical protein
MIQPPSWYKPLVIAALVWNLLGCLAYLGDVTTRPEDVARMSAAMRELHAARAPWAVSATAIAVWGGALGCLGLVLRRAWAPPVLAASFLGVIGQEIGLFVISDGARLGGPVVVVLQLLVFAISAGLVVLARHASRSGWLGRPAAPRTPA